MLKYRLIFGPLLIALLLTVVVLDDWLDTVVLSGFWRDLFRGRTHLPRGLALFGLSLIAVVLAARELSNIFLHQGIATRKTLTSVAAVLGVTLSYCIPNDTEAVTAIALLATGMTLVFVASILIFCQGRNVQGVVAAAGAVMFAMVYLGLLMGFFLAIRRYHSAWWVVGIILATKACDSGAYFTGRAIGRHKLIPWLSPGKTWEGLWGGLVWSAVSGLILAWLSQRFLGEQNHVPLVTGLWWGTVFGLVGVFGDLLKSVLKRSAGIKDSSSLLPGLGGVLDVLDSPLLVAPVAFWLIHYTI